MNSASDFVEEKQGFVQSLAPALPVMMGYLPIGFAYGVLAINAGLNIFQTVLISIVVFAGSAQLIAVSLFAQNAQAASIVATTFIVNLRHLLMSAALAPYLRPWRNWQVGIFGFELTDESFGVHSLRFPKGQNQPTTTISINLLCQFAWVMGSLLGATTGSLITDVRPFALDYALPAMFIALLIMQIRIKLQVFIAVISGLISVGFYFAGARQWHVILATLIGASLGAGVEAWQKQRS